MHKEPRVRQREPRVHRVRRVSRAFKVLRVRKAPRVLRDRRVPKVQRVLRDRRVPKVLKVVLALLGRLDSRERMELRALRA